ncbi:hypothetical protein [Laspinema olomoucense]|uniref:hypothetical protein n=1 Tax=Laspinema olomoucense TaxID=3231600 RepID=UPI0021BB5333|nr:MULTISPECIES: hypothetical protein [unclassified Laspinema]MCT7972303.1 hypothetical protein [Laspinema sp. D3d]MCT7995264.1 hypothetical protein [Laspinema sp. D3c]
MLNRFNKTSLNKRSPLVRGSSLFGKVNGAIALGLMLLVLPACEAADQTTTTTTTETGTDATTETGTDTTMTPAPGTDTSMTPAPGTETTTAAGTDTTMTPGSGTTTTPGMESTGMTTELGEVSDNPNQFMGQTVTLNGEVAEVLGPNVFRIQEDEAVGGSDLIVITTDSQMPVTQDSQVQVTGEVRELVMTEIERDYKPGWDDTTRTRIEREYTDRPAIVAQSVEQVTTTP